jgi:CHASE3 domain sensor protein
MNFEIDFGSSAAKSYQQLFEKMLNEARNKNDNLKLSVDETNQIRGRIAVLKELLALPNHKKIAEAQARIEHPE